MRILDRYILRSALSIFLACLLTFFFLYIIIDIFSHLEDILKHKIGFDLLSQYYLSFLPTIFVQVTPVASLLSTLYSFGKLNHNNELIAMRASGLSIYQITKTVTTFGIIVALGVFLINDQLLPKSIAMTQKIKEQIEQSETRKPQQKEQEVITNLSMYGLKNRLFFINKFYPYTNTLEGITVLEHDERQNITKKMVASKGIYSEGIWKFYKSVTYNFSENGQMSGNPQYFEEEIISIPETPQDFLTQRQHPDSMTILQLEDYLWKLSKSGAIGVVRNLKIELYQRYTDPLTNFIIVLIGIPFSFRMRRRATGLSSVGLSIMVGFLYYVLSAVSIALGRAGVMTPLLSTTFSHIIALMVSAYMIKKLP